MSSSRIRVSNLIHFWSAATKTRNPRDDRRGTIRFGSEVGQTGSSKFSFFSFFFFCRSLGLYGVVRVFLFNQHTGRVPQQLKLPEWWRLWRWRSLNEMTERFPYGIYSVEEMKRVESRVTRVMANDRV